MHVPATTPAMRFRKNVPTAPPMQPQLTIPSSLARYTGDSCGSRKNAIPVNSATAKNVVAAKMSFKLN